MKILILGGTRFFGVHTVTSLLSAGHEVTIATRGNIPDKFGDTAARVTLDRTDPESMKKALAGKYFDVLIDKSAYSSLDIKNAMETVSFGKYIFTSSTAVYEPKRINTIETDFDPTAKNSYGAAAPASPMTRESGTPSVHYGRITPKSVSLPCASPLSSERTTTPKGCCFMPSIP